jgi:predicted HTH domain antitoxin
MLVIEEDIVRSTQMSEQELRLEIALALFEKNVLSFGKARKLAGLTHFEFEKLLFDRSVPSKYTVEDLNSDLATLEKLRNK